MNDPQDIYNDLWDKIHDLVDSELAGCDYINLIENAQKETIAEDGVASWSGNPSDRRHSGHSSYMTPEYMLAHYKERLPQVSTSIPKK